MDDEEGTERIRRHHRRLLSSSSTPSPVYDTRNWVPVHGRGHSLTSVSKLGEIADVQLQDGPNKYINVSLLQRDYYPKPLVQTSNSSISRYYLLRSNRPSSVQITWRGGADGGGGGFPHSITGSDVRMLLTGGFTILLKIAGLLIARTVCGDMWPYLQAFSLCTLSIDSLKFLVPKVENICVTPLQGLAAPVLGLTLARPIVRWGLPDVYRTARFWRRLLPIYCGYMKTKYQVRGKSREETDRLWAGRHEWGGDKVHRLVLDLSGFYVKSAQILATKADFIPEPWIRHLSNHFDNAPPHPFSEVKRSIQEELAKCPQTASMPKDAKGLVPLDAAFLSVEETCIAAASIAQVHGAELKDGEQVVIKIQHLGMDLVMKSDLRNIVWVAKFLEGQIPFDLGPVIREIQRTIPMEFNFEREVWFMIAIKENLEKGGFERIVCPKPVIDLCATRLLVMERLEGIPFTHILHPEAPAELKGRIPEVVNIVEYLVLAYGQMFLQDGVFHADPHPGNLLLLADGRLGLIDFGQSKVLEHGLRKKLAKMILALGNNDDDEIAVALVELGMLFKDVNGGVVQSSTLAVMARILFDTCYVREATVSPMAEESILRQTPLTSFNQALWLVVRAMVMLRGLCYGLQMDLSSCALWRPYALRALEERDDHADNEDPVKAKWV